MAERTDLTTKELAEAIAEAVLESKGDVFGAMHIANGADAVCLVLDVYRCWFCRVSEHADGTHFEQMEMFERRTS